MQHADVRVVQPRNRLGLSLEPLLPVGVVSDVLGKDLDRDRPVEARVAGLIDFALAAGAQR